MFKIIKKNDQKRLIFRAGPTWMRRATQGHVAAPRGPTRRPRGVYIYLYILYSLYNSNSAFCISKGYSTPHYASHFKPTRFFYFHRVGLCSPFILLFQATWRHHKRWIKARDASRVNMVDARTTASPITAGALKAT